MLSPHWSDVEDPVGLTIPRLEAKSLSLSRSTPQLNSIMATQTELNAKESEMLKEKVLQLKMQRELLKKKLEDRLHALRELCLAEANITGVLPVEFPVIPGQALPQIKKRMGTEYSLSSKFLERDASKTNDAIDRLEMEIEVQQQILTASEKLADDKTLSKPIRKKHQLQCMKQKEKLKALEETLRYYRQERGTTKPYSKTTDDVEFESPKRADTSRNSEPSYSTLPNPHRRRPTTPQPHSSKDGYSSNTPSPYKISDSTLPSMDNSSISSGSSSVLSINQNHRLNPPTPPYRLDYSSAPLHGYQQQQQPYLGGRIQLPHLMSSSYQRSKGSSVSPSTVESSDLTSSCSSSLSSLQLSLAPDPSMHANLYQDPQQQQLAAPRGVYVHQNSGLDSTDYSNYLRNTQMAYYAPNGKFNCGSLDRKKMMKKHNGQRPIPETKTTRVIELAELTPSKFGSKRDSTTDSQDSPFQFEEDSDNLQPYPMPYHHRKSNNIRTYNAPSFGKLKESSSESSGIVSTLSPTEELRSIAEHQFVVPDKRHRRRVPAEHDASFQSGSSFQLPQQNGNPNNYSRHVSEMSEMDEYRESLRNLQQKHPELNCVKMTPSSLSADTYEPAAQSRKNKVVVGQSSRTRRRKSQPPRDDSNDESSDDAVDALFQTINRQSHVNAFEYSRKGSGVEVNDLLPNKRQMSNYTKSASSLSSSSSLSSGASAPRPLRFVKVIPNDPTALMSLSTSSSGQLAPRRGPLSSSSTNTSSTLTPTSFEIDTCSTLV